MSKSTANQMPSPMTKRRLKVKMAGTATNSTKNGKQTPWFVIGGFGDGTKKGESSASSSWNPGKCFPSKKFKLN